MRAEWQPVNGVEISKAIYQCLVQYALSNDDICCVFKHLIYEILGFRANEEHKWPPNFPIKGGLQMAQAFLSIVWRKQWLCGVLLSAIDWLCSKVNRLMGVERAHDF